MNETLQWKTRAEDLERNWAGCSRTCAKLQTERDAAYAELRKIWAGHHVLFDREVYNRVMKK